MIRQCDVGFSGAMNEGEEKNSLKLKGTLTLMWLSVWRKR